VDFPDWLLYPLFVGLPVFVTIKIRLDKSFFEKENIFLWAISIGLILSIPFYFVRDYLIYNKVFVVPNFLSNEGIDAINLVFAFTVGSLFSYYFVKEKYINAVIVKQDSIDNSLEEEAVYAIKSHITTMENDTAGNTSLIEHMIELKNGKTYVGIITHIDLRQESGFLKIIPIKSSFRKDGIMDSFVDYKSKEIVEQGLLPPEILLPKLEIVTFRQFNSELDSHFNAEKKKV
jgi:hypothetical protein